jgi:hypothetical protein
MKLACLTSSLGEDGVGDYTRGLVREWKAAGHRCLLISLNESDVTCEGEAECGAVLRLAGSLPWKRRTGKALAALHQFQPDWVSLQFVCYGFHPKGLTFDHARRFAPLFTTGRGHVMLHELWIGESTGYGLKDRLIGWLQKRGVISLLRTLRPAVIHTSNPVYRELLRRYGLKALELPLPGNIPVITPVVGGFETLLRRHGLPFDSLERDDWWIAGVFGTIQRQWSPLRFLDELCTLARKKRKRMLFLHFGRTHKDGAAVWQKLAEQFGTGGTFLVLGPQEESVLSTVLQAVNFGIATSPWALIGKSGCAAAMLDHGLPVAVPDDDWQLRRGLTPEPTADPLLFQADDFLKALCLGSIERRAPHSRFASIAEQFLRDLAAASSGPRLATQTRQIPR